MDVEVPDEAAGSAEGGPPATAGGGVVVLPFPRELRAGRSVACAVAGVEEALECAEGDLAIRRVLEAEMRFLDEVEEVIVPVVHLDDAPAAGEGLGEGWNLCHQAVSAMSLGSRTRL